MTKRKEFVVTIQRNDKRQPDPVHVTAGSIIEAERSVRQIYRRQLVRVLSVNLAA